MYINNFAFLFLLVSLTSLAQEEYRIPENSSLVFSGSKYGGTWDYFVGDQIIVSKYTIQRSYASIDGSGLAIILAPSKEQIEKLPIATRIKPIPPNKIQIDNPGEVAPQLIERSKIDRILNSRSVAIGEAEFFISSYSSGIECDYREYHVTVKSVIKVVLAATIGKASERVC